MRVYELARELDITNRDLLAMIRQLGIEVSNHMATLAAVDVTAIRREVQNAVRGPSRGVTRPPPPVASPPPSASSFDTAAPVALAAALARCGRDIVLDPRRTEALIRDICAKTKRECNIIIIALRAGVATDLYASRPSEQGSVVGRLTRRLQEDYALEPGAAGWVVETWAKILHGSTPTPTTPTNRPETAQTPRPTANPQRGIPVSGTPTVVVRERGAASRAPSGALRLGASPGGFVAIPAGCFLMGSPDHERGRTSAEFRRIVTITRKYLMKVTPVTQAEYANIMLNNPSTFQRSGGAAPVESVSWHDAIAFLNKLSDRDGLPRAYDAAGGFLGLECPGYRLPTEAEWEYACRAGRQDVRYGAVGAIAWYSANAHRTPQEVARKQSNAWGLYDMLGNVWEWTNDWYAAYGPDETSDPTGPSRGTHRTRRGGSFESPEDVVRAAQRASAAPDSVSQLLGFRAVRTML